MHIIPKAAIGVIAINIYENVGVTAVQTVIAVPSKKHVRTDTA